MVLTFAEDFSSNAVLDGELTGKSPSGLSWNRGVHPVLTTDNLVHLLPITSLTFTDWTIGKSYSEFNTSRSKVDIVNSNGKIYQSLKDGNVGNAVTDANWWLETNLESLRVKAFIWSVEDNMTSALSIERKLIENQYIYNVGKNYRQMSGINGWAFEPKGSDYVTIRINEMSLQSEGTTPISLYVINQGRLVDTLTLTPNDGALVFERKDYVISGKGAFYFVYDSELNVKGDAYNDALKYSGFTCYPVSGSGDKLTADYVQAAQSNGLNFNVSAFLDSSVYLDNNKIDFARMLQVQMEMDFIKMLSMNTNSRDNRVQEMLGNGVLSLITTESLDLDLNTIARKYRAVLKEYKDVINTTFDKFLKSKPKFVVKKKTV